MTIMEKYVTCTPSPCLPAGELALYRAVRTFPYYSSVLRLSINYKSFSAKVWGRQHASWCPEKFVADSIVSGDNIRLSVPLILNFSRFMDLLNSTVHFNAGCLFMHTAMSISSAFALYSICINIYLREVFVGL